MTGSQNRSSTQLKKPPIIKILFILNPYKANKY